MPTTKHLVVKSVSTIPASCDGEHEHLHAMRKIVSLAGEKYFPCKRFSLLHRLGTARPVCCSRRKLHHCISHASPVISEKSIVGHTARQWVLSGTSISRCICCLGVAGDKVTLLACFLQHRSLKALALSLRAACIPLRSASASASRGWTVKHYPWCSSSDCSGARLCAGPACVRPQSLFQTFGPFMKPGRGRSKATSGEPPPSLLCCITSHGSRPVEASRWGQGSRGKETFRR